MILYYAIISFCLGTCSDPSDMHRYIYNETIAYEQCLTKVEEMAQTIRMEIPETIHSPISMLCVQKDVLKNKERYEEI